MGFFERPDLRLIQSADLTPLAAVFRAFRHQVAALAICGSAIVVAYGAYIELGLHHAARTQGLLLADGLYDPVTIVRDGRDIPHIAARNEHDMYFGQGYVEGSDRLFQLDLTRRYAYGRLAEVLGAKALELDKMQRAVDVDAIAQRQLLALEPRDREALAAFSDGVNAAAATQPLPVEFRILLYRPAFWTPKDSLAVSIVASLVLSDSWHDVFARDAVWRHSGPRCFEALFPLSDPPYDVTIGGAPISKSVRASHSDCGAPAAVAAVRRHAIGSNAWAVGGLRTLDGNALLANDPHLDLTIPGIWYLVDIASPKLHAAGATIPGIPGVVLGHNERLAWATTNAEMSTTSVFTAGRLRPASWVVERFRVRFARDALAAYYRTSRDFSVPNENDRSTVALVRWPIYAEARSTIATVLELDRAGSVRDALAVLTNYRGPPQNFMLADRDGDVAYHVAGLIPRDPAWGRYVHAARDLRRSFDPIAFGQLPGRAPGRGATFISANNKPYGFGYPYRLSAQFEPPYRAYRIAQLLRARRRYAPSYFARMQVDTLSPIDLEIARAVVRFVRTDDMESNAAEVRNALARWDGRFQPDSRAAALEHAFRLALFQGAPPFGARLDALRGDRGNLARQLARDGAVVPVGFQEVRAWRDAGGVRIDHPLAPMNFAFLNGTGLPGAGDEYTFRLQEPGFAQGFRPVWDVGNWDRGGISIPSGESGEPGSGHYTDLTRAWVDGVLQPLPFSQAAIKQNAAGVLVLRPR
jgi:penicillin amidase